MCDHAKGAIWISRKNVTIRWFSYSFFISIPPSVTNMRPSPQESFDCPQFSLHPAESFTFKTMGINEFRGRYRVKNLALLVQFHTVCDETYHVVVGVSEFVAFVNYFL